jgi:hypothetical protein
MHMHDPLLRNGMSTLCQATQPDIAWQTYLCHAELAARNLFGDILRRR